MKKAIYPGSFDPVTFGHIDVIKRSAAMVDELIVSVLSNSIKNPLFTVEERVTMLEEVTRDVSNITITSFSGLLVDYVKKTDAKLIVRGLRAITDFEYELQMAQTNRILCPEVDTVFLTTSLEYAYLNSTTVKEVAKYGGEIRKFVPLNIAEKVYQKFDLR